MVVVKINWSGGKDSTVSVILHYQSGDMCIEVLKYLEYISAAYATKGKVYRDGTKWSDRLEKLH